MINLINFVYAQDAVIPSYTSDIVTKTGIVDLNTTTVGGIFSALLPYILTLAGLALLVMLILGGISLMTAAGNPDKIKAGSGRITMALVGFLVIFISYFIVQLVGFMLGADLLMGGGNTNSNCSTSNCSNCNKSECSGVGGCKWAGGVCMPDSSNINEETQYSGTIGEASCGGANGGTYDTLPTNLCNVGNSNITDNLAFDGNYNWTCISGESEVPCKAYKVNNQKTQELLDSL
jgi:hypothetical protein